MSGEFQKLKAAEASIVDGAATMLPGIASAAAWFVDCQRDKQGQPLGNLANALLALRSDPTWRDVLAFDEMRRCNTVLRPVPGTYPADDDDQLPRPMRDADVSAGQEWLQLAGIARLGKDTAHQAIDLFARERPFHPIREWLADLEWDSTPRLGSWLTDYLGVEADADGYAVEIGRHFLTSMIARVMSPGCKADHMLVIEGDQGTLKSTACKILAGDAYFSDSMPPDVAGKDAALHLRGKWLIELSEMHALTKSETTALKAFLTRTTDIYRPPYGRLEVYEERQCVFIGTTNASEYLKDETGGRRFWPVKAGTIRPELLQRDRDQLFAEALAAYRQGETWWPDAEFERRVIRPHQTSRQMTDVWQSLVETYLEHESRVTVLQVAAEALTIKAEHVGTADQRRIASILTTAGWRRGPRLGTGRWWLPPVSQ